MSDAEIAALQALALRVRRHIIRMSGGGGCFLGASLSCADVLVYLYSRFLRHSPWRPADPNRDVLLLSKGHDVPALYGTLAELGYFDAARLANHLRTTDVIYWHPNREVPGIEFHSGSLGHLLSVGIGIALDMRLRRSTGRVVVILGDGELDEGSVWEALLFASSRRLENLFAVVDRNGLQANVATEDLTPLEPLGEKLRAFGAAVRTADGHDFTDLDRAFRAAAAEPPAPRVVVANTVRGKGLPSIEGRVDRWFCRFTPAEVQELLGELEGSAAARLASEVVVAR